MDTILDYIQWVGGLTFEEKPFCHIDAIVLSELSYYDFKLFDDRSAQPMTLRETCAAVIRERGLPPEFTAISDHPVKQLIDAAARSERFGGLLLKNYTEELDLEKAIQFCGVTFEHKGDFSFIAFRGTDVTLAGWKEDFMISFTRTKAQEMALSYAAKNIVPGVRNFIGGHSKGANLALYAAANLRFELWDQVERVYILDGPGFCGEVLDTSTVQKVNRRATRIIPQFCIIGKLFEPKIADTIIVDSSDRGFMQHDLFSWAIEHGELKTVTQIDPQAEQINDIIDRWLQNISQSERRQFVDDFFDALTADGAQTVQDVMQDGPSGVENVLISLLGAGKETKKAVAELPSQALFGNTTGNIRKTGLLQWLDKNQTAKSLILFAVGLFFIIASEKALEITAIGFFIALAVAELIITVRRLYLAKWDFGKIRLRLYLLVILIAICFVFLLKKDALFMLGSIFYGVVAIILAFRQLSKALTKGGDPVIRLIHAAETILLFVFGVIFLLADYESIFGFSLSIGIMMTVDAAFRLGYRIYRNYHPQTKHEPRSGRQARSRRERRGSGEKTRRR